MLLAKLTHTVGDTRRRIVNYYQMLEPGENAISSAKVTVDKPDVVISGVTVLHGQKVAFLAAGGSLNEVFTVTVQVTLRNTEIVTDTIQFTCVAP